MKLITSLRGPGLQLHLSIGWTIGMLWKIVYELTKAWFTNLFSLGLSAVVFVCSIFAPDEFSELCEVLKVFNTKPGKATTTKPKPTSNVPKTTVTPQPQKKRKLRVSSPKVHRFETLKTQLDRGDIAQEKLAQDDDDEDMPELLDIRHVQGEIEAAVSP